MSNRWAGVGCVVCVGTGELGFFEEDRVTCPRCHGTGRIPLLNDKNDDPREKRKIYEARHHIDVSLYSIDELVDILSDQGLTKEKIHELCTEMQRNKEIKEITIEEGVREVINAGIMYARFFESWKLTPSPSVLERDLRAEAKQLRASAKIVKRAVSGKAFLPGNFQIHPHLPCAQARNSRNMPRAIALRVRNPSAEIYLERLAEDLEAHADFLRKIPLKLAISSNKEHFVLLLMAAWNTATSEDALKLRIGGCEHSISPILRYLSVATRMVSKTRSGMEIAKISGSTLRRYAIAVQKKCSAWAAEESDA
ncbi:hypothetical protein [Aurantimonas sp. HBX-1]|uniref:hypothetical protein n=1 Tax=Aurantimonas sp. HBX-1 TaxID=2906072 RepID=UPI001F1D2746|nr:hypothetical protein [Aurantimonas sp. HBX-1]UIJ72356.1 hypothetical protein LXB15_01415 [Aurantimonas sp. HBX-1]